MTDESDTAAEEALLMELAQLGMGLVRKVHGLALRPHRHPAARCPDRRLPSGQPRRSRQSLALRARFARGTVAPAPRAEASQAADTPRPEIERADRSDYERPDWHTPVPANERLERLDPDPDVCRARIARDLTVVSRTPALAKIPALQAPAAHLAARAALLTGASLRLVDTILKNPSPRCGSAVGERPGEGGADIGPAPPWDPMAPTRQPQKSARTAHADPGDDSWSNAASGRDRCAALTRPLPRRCRAWERRSPRRPYPRDDREARRGRREHGEQPRQRRPVARCGRARQVRASQRPVSGTGRRGKV